MNTRITGVILIVKNRAEALEFYTEKLGFEKKLVFPTPDGHKCVAVGPKGQDLQLSLWQAGWTDGVGKNWKAGGSPQMVLHVDDCQQTYDELKSKGVHFEMDVQKTSYGVVAFFTDPDGNLFEIHQSKAPGSQEV
jgi:catechol 2,3-dioxygenase-like lactoylglutathione lyase family enzyme